MLVTRLYGWWWILGKQSSRNCHHNTRTDTCNNRAALQTRKYWSLPLLASLPLSPMPMAVCRVGSVSSLWPSVYPSMKQSKRSLIVLQRPYRLMLISGTAHSYVTNQAVGCQTRGYLPSFGASPPWAGTSLCCLVNRGACVNCTVRQKKGTNFLMHASCLILNRNWWVFSHTSRKVYATIPCI